MGGISPHVAHLGIYILYHYLSPTLWVCIPLSGSVRSHTMAEAFGVIAIVSSIVQLVDFTSKIINRLHEFQSGASEGYKSLRELQAELPLLEHALSQIKLATERSVLSIACVIALQPTITGVEECLREIDSILAKTLPNQGDGRTRRAIKSVGSVWNDTNVEKFRSTLRSYITTLTFYFATSSSTLGLTTGKSVDLEVDESVNNYHFSYKACRDSTVVVRSGSFYQLSKSSFPTST